MAENKRIQELMAVYKGEIEKQEADIGFMARLLTQTTLPHRERRGQERTTWTRTNGLLTMHVTGPFGIPTGSIPRILLTWMTSEIVRTRSPVLVLGQSQREFLEKVGVSWGGFQMHQIRKQMTRLLTSMIQVTAKQNPKDRFPSYIANLVVAEDSLILWNPKDPDEPQLWESQLAVSNKFFRECIEHPVPVDMRIVDALSYSPLAIDIYVWLVHRTFSLRKPVVIPWEALQMQFGAEYRRARDFRRHFIERLKEVKTLCPQLKLAVNEDGLRIDPCPKLVPFRRGRKKSHK